MSCGTRAEIRRIERKHDTLKVSSVPASSLLSLRLLIARLQRAISVLGVSNCTRRNLYRIAFSLILVGTSTRPAASEPSPEPGRITGHLENVAGDRSSVSQVVVFLVDGDSGYPVHADTRRPIRISEDSLEINKFWTVLTDEEGGFEFKNVRPGKYRLIAQSWSKTQGVPKVPGNTSPIVMLHGIAENVELNAGQQMTAPIRQLGSGFMRIENDPKEGNAFLMISVKPMIGDAILGPYGWGKDFVSHIIGVTHMDQPHVTLFGLPDNSDVHVALLNYDNNPGVGSATFKAGQRTGNLRIVATWSNGHRDPPPRLKALTEHLAAKKMTHRDFIAGDAAQNLNDAQQKMIQLIQQDPQRQIDVAGLGPQRLIDVAAALTYVSIQKPK